MTLPAGAEFMAQVAGMRCGWSGFLRENSDFSMQRVHNNFDHLIFSSTLYFN